MKKREEDQGLEPIRAILEEYKSKTNEAIQGAKFELKIDTLSEELCKEINHLTGDVKHIKDRVDFLEHKSEKKDVQYEAELDETTLLELLKLLPELLLKQLQLRFRVVHELSREDIRSRMIKYLAHLIN